MSVKRRRMDWRMPQVKRKRDRRDPLFWVRCVVVVAGVRGGDLRNGMAASVDFEKIAGGVEDEVLAFYFGFIAGFAGGVRNLPGFGDLCAGVMLFYISSDGRRQVAGRDGDDLFDKTAAGAEEDGVVFF